MFRLCLYRPHENHKNSIHEIIKIDVHNQLLSSIQCSFDQFVLVIICFIYGIAIIYTHIKLQFFIFKLFKGLNIFSFSVKIFNVETSGKASYK